MKPHAVVTQDVGTSGHVPWRERLDLYEIEAEADEEGFDDLLESLEEGGAAAARMSVNRTPLNTGNLHRASSAPPSNWESEFADAQEHARNILANMR